VAEPAGGQTLKTTAVSHPIQQSQALVFSASPASPKRVVRAQSLLRHHRAHVAPETVTMPLPEHPLSNMRGLRRPETAAGTNHGNSNNDPQTGGRSAPLVTGAV